MLKIKWIDKITNEEVHDRIREKRSFENKNSVDKTLLDTGDRWEILWRVREEKEGEVEDLD